MRSKAYKINMSRVIILTSILLITLYLTYTYITPTRMIESLTLEEDLSDVIISHLNTGDEVSPRSAYIIREFQSKNRLGQVVDYRLQLTDQGDFVIYSVKNDTFHQIPFETQEKLYDLQLDMIIYSDTKLPQLFLNETSELDYGGSWTKERLNGQWIETDIRQQKEVQTIEVDEYNQTIKLTSTYPMVGSVQWFLDGQLIGESPLTEDLHLPSKEGNYTADIYLQWEDSNFSGQGALELHVNVDYDTEIEISKLNVQQGDLIRIIAKNTKGESLTIDQMLATQVKFFPQNDHLVAYIPITYRDDDGTYPITIKEGDEILLDEVITVTDRHFHIQHLVIDETIAASTRNDAAYEEFNQYFPPSREVSTFKSSGQPFILPVAGRLSTEYGETRHVNGSPTSYRHSGLDLANPTGTPILATNSGLVTLSMNLTLTGNTVVIDHGNGIFSTHFHLHDRYVEKGDLVNIGEEIGTVGTTGFSTGPHLHFTTSYYAQNIEPGILIYGEPVTYDNYKKLFNP